MKPTLLGAALLVGLIATVPVTAQEEKDTLPDGLKALKHADPDVRYRAIDLLLRLGKVSRFAIPNLREALFDDNPYVRVKAAEALWLIERPKAVILVPTLLTALKDKAPQVRVRSAAVLGQMKDEAAEAVPWLVRGLRDPELDVKLECISALGEIGPAARDAVTSLLNLSKEDDFFLMEPMIGVALGNLGKDVVPTLAKALKETPAKKRLALFALGNIGLDAKEAVPAIAGRLKDADAPIRGQAALALAKIGPAAAEARAELDKAIQDDDPLVTIQVAHALWQVAKHAPSLVVLGKGLDHAKADVRVQACRLVGDVGAGGKDLVAPLTQRLKDDDTTVQSAAIESLGKLGPSAATAAPPLRLLLTEKDDGLRLSVALALWQITEKADDALPILPKTFTHEDPALRRRAYSIAAALGKQGQPLVAPLLERWPQELDAKRALAEALKKIDPEAAAKAGIR